jgi:hypothetical protein
VRYLDIITSQKMRKAMRREIASIPDTMSTWIAHYLQFAVRGVRSEAVAQKISLHLLLFQAFYLTGYGHDRISTCLKRDVVAWRTPPSTITWHHPRRSPPGSCPKMTDKKA